MVKVMNGATARNKPSGKCGQYVVQNNAVYFDQKKDDYLLVMEGVAYVDGFVIDAATDIRTCLVAIDSAIGEPCMIRVNMAKLSTGKSVCEFLAERGVIVANAGHASRFLLNSASTARNLPIRQLIQNPGWFAKHRGFYTGNTVIASDAIDTSEYWFEPARETPMRAKGTLSEWQDQVGCLISLNFMILAMTCIGLASTLLDRLGLSSSMINFWGLKAVGKTTGQQCAASFFGNAIDPAQGAQSTDPAFIARFNGTINGFESLLARYTPLPILLDEMTEGSAITICEAPYMMSSGQGKHRRTSDGKAAKRDFWQLNIILSSERSIVDTITSTGKRMLGGQADRAVDIPITETGMLTSFGTFESFDAATRNLKRACGEQYGTAGEAFLQYCVDNPEEVLKKIQMSQSFEADLMPANCGPGELRVIKRFAGAKVAGLIANDAGIFGRDVSQEISDAIELVTKLWWSERSNCLTRVAAFLEENQDNLQISRPKLLSDAMAFVGPELTVIPVEVFNNEFGRDAQGILNELAGLGALKTEQEGRHVHRFCNNEFRGYAIRTDKIWPGIDFAN